MTDVYIVSDNIVSSLGFTTDENMDLLRLGQTGIKQHHDDRISPAPFWASMVNSEILARRFADISDPPRYTYFEQMVIVSLRQAMVQAELDLTTDRTLLILSTTKGNIDVLNPNLAGEKGIERAYLWQTAQLLQYFFGFRLKPMVVSNACISGVLALIIGSRLIRAGEFDHVVIAGADIVSEFVLSGFNSFMSLCTGPCKPFDKERQGLSLGEAAGTIVLSNDKELANKKDKVVVGPGFSSNDANHISGPSRTGEGLYIAIKRTLQQTTQKVDYISAHGTATPYNDEMESIAISRAGLQDVPVNSLKGYWGHTLGAAGVIEAIAAVHSMYGNVLIKTVGYNTMGVTHPINIIDKNRETKINTCLKIASGFGGCNASVLLYKK
ncbi:MAG: hypothetical protein JXQ80_06925 [Bacteroidales bacterium]|nr:hypothetical protein [Bacteroidales bacterium]